MAGADHGKEHLDETEGARGDAKGIEKAEVNHYLHCISMISRINF